MKEKFRRGRQKSSTNADATAPQLAKVAENRAKYSRKAPRKSTTEEPPVKRSTATQRSPKKVSCVIVLSNLPYNVQTTKQKWVNSWSEQNTAYYIEVCDCEWHMCQSRLYCQETCNIYLVPELCVFHQIRAQLWSVSLSVTINPNIFIIREEIHLCQMTCRQRSTVMIRARRR